MRSMTIVTLASIVLGVALHAAPMPSRSAPAFHAPASHMPIPPVNNGAAVKPIPHEQVQMPVPPAPAKPDAVTPMPVPPAPAHTQAVLPMPVPPAPATTN